MGLLSGRRFVITGAGRGLGAAFAMVFAAEGAALVLTGRDTAALGRVADAIADTGAERPETARLDLSEPVEAAAVARDIAARCPDIDGLINKFSRKWAPMRGFANKLQQLGADMVDAPGSFRGTPLYARAQRNAAVSLRPLSTPPREP